LAGRFVTAPDPVAPADPAAPGNHLQALRTRDLHGFVLFALDGDAEPATAELDALMARAASDQGYAGAVTAEIGCNWKTYLEQRLAAAGAEGFAWQWPLLLARAASGGAIVEQIVPRTFLRTRVVFHAWGAAHGALQGEADAAKAACEALQAD